MDNTALLDDLSCDIGGLENNISAPHLSHQVAFRSQAVGRSADTQGKVFVVDGSGAIRDAVGELLKEHGYLVETFETGPNFLASYRPDDDDRACLLVDALLPEMSGIDLVEYLRGEGDQLPAIVFSGHADVPMAVQAMKVGAVDFLEKPVGCDDLLASIRRALEKRQETAGMSKFLRASADRVASLTQRQKQILDLILAGHPTKNIAVDLGIGLRTVDNHRAAIARKTGSKSMSALIHTAACADCSFNQFNNHPNTNAPRSNRTISMPGKYIPTLTLMTGRALECHPPEIHELEVQNLKETHMNWDRIAGDWKQMSGKVKEKWGKLTDDDLAVINGRRDQLEGKIQERYGYGKDQVKKDLDAWSASL